MKIKKYENDFQILNGRDTFWEKRKKRSFLCRVTPQERDITEIRTLPRRS
jgi:hypothetical protein